MAKKKQLTITLKRGLSGRIQKHRATIKGLGLSRINQTVEREDTPCIRGMINQVGYLLSVEETSSCI